MGFAVDGVGDGRRAEEVVEESDGGDGAVGGGVGVDLHWAALLL